MALLARDGFPEIVQGVEELDLLYVQSQAQSIHVSSYLYILEGVSVVGGHGEDGHVRKRSRIFREVACAQTIRRKREKDTLVGDEARRLCLELVSAHVRTVSDVKGP